MLWMRMIYYQTLASIDSGIINKDVSKSIAATLLIARLIKNAESKCIDPFKINNGVHTWENMRSVLSYALRCLLILSFPLHLAPLSLLCFRCKAVLQIFFYSVKGDCRSCQVGHMCAKHWEMCLRLSFLTHSLLNRWPVCQRWSVKHGALYWR